MSHPLDRPIWSALTTRQASLAVGSGEALRLSPGYGVCTHPDARGRGYAGALMRTVIERILGRGETAFLHSYADNAGAIALYHSLGFSVRSRMAMRMLGSGES